MSTRDQAMRHVLAPQQTRRAQESMSVRAAGGSAGGRAWTYLLVELRQVRLGLLLYRHGGSCCGMNASAGEVYMVGCWKWSGTERLQMCLLGGERSDCGQEQAGRSVMFAKYVSAFTSQTGKHGLQQHSAPALPLCMQATRGMSTLVPTCRRWASLQCYYCPTAHAAKVSSLARYYHGSGEAAGHVIRMQTETSGTLGPAALSLPCTLAINKQPFHPTYLSLCTSTSARRDIRTFFLGPPLPRY